jgi:hypothetical protein
LIMQLVGYVKYGFPYWVELAHTHRDMADNWLHVNVPDTGDDGDEDGWMWYRSPVTPTNTHIYAFKRSDHAAEFALAWG